MARGDDVHNFGGHVHVPCNVHHDVHSPLINSIVKGKAHRAALLTKSCLSTKNLASPIHRCIQTPEHFSWSLYYDCEFIDLGIFHKNFATVKDKYGRFHIDKKGE